MCRLRAAAWMTLESVCRGSDRRQRPSGVSPPSFCTGRAGAQAKSPQAARIAAGPNADRETDYRGRVTAPEVTCRCPITGQQDFAHFGIDYTPAKSLLESKSLKLFLASFRNHGAFHEDCTVAIGKKLFALLTPKWLRIGGHWYPPGGMPIDRLWPPGQLP